jgi:hypothetical protein
VPQVHVQSGVDPQMLPGVPPHFQSWKQYSFEAHEPQGLGLVASAGASVLASDDAPLLALLLHARSAATRRKERRMARSADSRRGAFARLRYDSRGP